MKGVGFVLLLLCTPFPSAADFVHWLGAYETAHHKALQTDKPLLVLVVKKSASNAAALMRECLMDRPYVKTINRKTVAVIVTYEGYESYPVEMYYTTVFPTLFMVDASKEIFLKPPLYGKDICSGRLPAYLDAL
jgi:hypothetical protein